MIAYRAHEIVTAGLVLIGGNFVLAQGVPAMTPPPSPYYARSAQPAGAFPASTGAMYIEPGGIYPGLASGCGSLSFGYVASPGSGMPLGESIALHLRAQIGNAAVARMTLYDFDFVQGRSQLNYRGRDRLHQIAGRLATSPNSLIVERLPLDPELALARRAAVQLELAALGLKLSPDRVLVGPPLAVPLRGVEAEGIYGTLMIQTESAGSQPGSSSASGGRTGSSGASSGATPTGR